MNKIVKYTLFFLLTMGTLMGAHRKAVNTNKLRLLSTDAATDVEELKYYLNDPQSFISIEDHVKLNFSTSSIYSQAVESEANILYNQNDFTVFEVPVYLLNKSLSDVALIDAINAVILEDLGQAAYDALKSKLYIVRAISENEESQEFRVLVDNWGAGGFSNLSEDRKTYFQTFYTEFMESLRVGKRQEIPYVGEQTLKHINAAVLEDDLGIEYAILDGVDLSLEEGSLGPENNPEYYYLTPAGVPVKFSENINVNYIIPNDVFQRGTGNIFNTNAYQGGLRSFTGNNEKKRGYYSNNANPLKFKGYKKEAFTDYHTFDIPAAGEEVNIIVGEYKLDENNACKCYEYTRKYTVPAHVNTTGSGNAMPLNIDFNNVGNSNDPNSLTPIGDGRPAARHQCIKSKFARAFIKAHLSNSSDELKQEILAAGYMIEKHEVTENLYQDFYSDFFGEAMGADFNTFMKDFYKIGGNVNYPSVRQFREFREKLEVYADYHSTMMTAIEDVVANSSSNPSDVYKYYFQIGLGQNKDMDIDTRKALIKLMMKDEVHTTQSNSAPGVELTTYSLVNDHLFGANEGVKDLILARAIETTPDVEIPLILEFLRTDGFFKKIYNYLYGLEEDYSNNYLKAVTKITQRQAGVYSPDYGGTPTLDMTNLYGKVEEIFWIKYPQDLRTMLNTIRKPSQNNEGNQSQLVTFDYTASMSNSAITISQTTCTKYKYDFTDINIGFGNSGPSGTKLPCCLECTQSQENTVVLDPFDLVIVTHAEKTGYLSICNGECQNKMIVVPAIMMKYLVDRKQSIETVNFVFSTFFTTLEIASYVVGIGELSAALRVGNRIRAIVVALDLGLQVLGTAINDPDMQQWLQDKFGEHADFIINITNVTSMLGSVALGGLSHDLAKEAGDFVGGVNAILDKKLDVTYPELADELRTYQYITEYHLRNEGFGDVLDARIQNVIITLGGNYPNLNPNLVTAVRSYFGENHAITADHLLYRLNNQEELKTLFEAALANNVSDNLFSSWQKAFDALGSSNQLLSNHYFIEQLNLFRQANSSLFDGLTDVQSNTIYLTISEVFLLDPDNAFVESIPDFFFNKFNLAQGVNRITIIDNLTMLNENRLLSGFIDDMLINPPANIQSIVNLINTKPNAMNAYAVFQQTESTWRLDVDLLGRLSDDMEAAPWLREMILEEGDKGVIAWRYLDETYPNKFFCTN